MSTLLAQHQASGYLCFILKSPRSERRRTEIWNVVGARNGVGLGELRWFARWRQYAFYPAPGTIFNPDCLRDIGLACGELTRRQRAWRETT